MWGMACGADGQAQTCHCVLNRGQELGVTQVTGLLGPSHEPVGLESMGQHPDSTRGGLFTSGTLVRWYRQEERPTRGPTHTSPPGARQDSEQRRPSRALVARAVLDTQSTHSKAACHTPPRTSGEAPSQPPRLV